MDKGKEKRDEGKRKMAIKERLLRSLLFQKEHRNQYHNQKKSDAKKEMRKLKRKKNLKMMKLKMMMKQKKE